MKINQYTVMNGNHENPAIYFHISKESSKFIFVFAKFL